MKFSHLILSTLAIFHFSCSDDDLIHDTPLGSYDQGVLVLNEGGMGEITYLSNDLQTVQQNAFEIVNGEDYNLGAYAQSVFFDGDRAFVISNGSNKITVMNRYTLEYIETISTGLQVPRFGAVFNGKAYVTNSGDFMSATDDFVAVINLNSLTVEGSIAMNDQAERILEHNGKIYVSGGFYGVGNNINVINPASNAVVSTINVGGSPNTLVAEGDTLYVLCSGFTTDSKLVRVNLLDETTSEAPFASTMGNASNLYLYENQLYFNVGRKVYSIPTGATSVTDAPLFDTMSTSAYIGYGFAVHNNRIYISEAADDFSSDGKIFVYDMDGTLLKQAAAGLGPNGFYFND